MKQKLLYEKKISELDSCNFTTIKVTRGKGKSWIHKKTSNNGQYLW